MLTGIVTDAVAAIVRLPGASLETGAPLRNIGMDSLMALEIRNQLQDRAGVTIPLVTIVEGPSISELVTLMLASLDTAAVTREPSGASRGAGQAEDMTGLDELSDENVDAMLRRMLAER